MKKTFTIEVKEPCAQSWAEMTPQETGRFCAACQKTVTDFTAFTDEEFTAFFQQKKETGCGRFTKRQLSISIIPPSKRINFGMVNRIAAASLLTALGLPLQASAQAKDTTVQQSIFNNKPDSVLYEQLLQIKGTVKEPNGEGIPGVSITIAGTNSGTMTDVDGNFELELPKKEEGYTLTIASIPYGKKEINVNQPGHIDIVMDELEGTIGIVTVVRVKHSFWYRITHPFRKKRK
jgi:hypothetical protein